MAKIFTGEDECPYIQWRFEEGVALCEITSKLCLVEEGLQCETWGELKKEIEEN